MIPIADFNSLNIFRPILHLLYRAPVGVNLKAFSFLQDVRHAPQDVSQAKVIVDAMIFGYCKQCLKGHTIFQDADQIKNQSACPQSIDKIQH